MPTSTPRPTVRGHRVPTRTAALLFAGSLALAAPLLTATSAAAHDRLESTNPADGSTVEVAPASVDLTMSSSPLALGTLVEVTGPDGVVSTGEAQIVDDTVSQPLDDSRPAGDYSVAWRVTSSDGHPISGTFTFSATGAVGAPPESSAPTTTESSAATPTESSAAPSPATIDPSLPTDDPGNRTLIAVAVAAVVVVGGVGGIIGYRRRNR